MVSWSTRIGPSVAAKPSHVASKWPADHLPRERVVEWRPSPASTLRASPFPTICRGNGWSSQGPRFPWAAVARGCKLGEDITETLEVIPRQWKVIQHVRGKFTCRDCEKISQAPAPFSVLARGSAGPSLLAMILFEKCGQHQPLNRQAERYARRAYAQLIDACRSGRLLLRRAGAAAPSHERHVFAAERLHSDDTTEPVLAKGETDIRRCWVYERDDRPFSGPAPPAAMFYYSRDRGGNHLQAHLAINLVVFAGARQVTGVATGACRLAGGSLRGPGRCRMIQGAPLQCCFAGRTPSAMRWRMVAVLTARTIAACSIVASPRSACSPSR